LPFSKPDAVFLIGCKFTANLQFPLADLRCGGWLLVGIEREEEQQLFKARLITLHDCG
jgi:hypothetical protein